MLVRTIVEPALLRWGRETAGLAVEDAARRVQIPPERLESWEAEAGDIKPTIGQLRRLANLYHRPLSVFFLPEPPAEPALEIHDFRQLPGQVAGELSSVLLLQLRRARERRPQGGGRVRAARPTPSHERQQPGAALPRPGPLRRGRAAPQAGTGDPREGARAGSPRKNEIVSSSAEASVSRAPISAAARTCAFGHSLWPPACGRRTHR